MKKYFKSALAILLCFIISLLVLMFIKGDVYVFNWEVKHRALTVVVCFFLLLCSYIIFDTE